MALWPSGSSTLLWMPISRNGNCTQLRKAAVLIESEVFRYAAFGELPLKKITAQVILDYQKERIQNVSGRTVNLEIGLLRRVLRKNKQWSRLADDVRMLPEDPKEA